MAIVKSHHLIDIIILICCSLSLFTHYNRLLISRLQVQVLSGAPAIPTDYREFKCREKRSGGTCVFTGRKTVGKFIESIPAGFDTYQNYIGVQSVKYKEVKPTKTNPPFIYKLIQKAELKQRTLGTS